MATAARTHRKPRPDTRTIALARMVENLAVIVAEARHTLRWHGTMADGHPASNGEPTVSGGGGTSSVEAAALARHTIAADLRQIDDDLATITVMVADLTRMAYRIVGRPELDPENARCSGGRGHRWANAGALEWGDDTCAEKIHGRGLCSKHYMAARRWALAHGLEWADLTPTEV